ncbi:hypothetical protein SH467x_002193 [Pirellulaceae bacterium SH467]
MKSRQTHSLRNRLWLASLVTAVGVVGGDRAVHAQLLLDPPPEALPNPQVEANLGAQASGQIDLGVEGLESLPEEAEGITPLLRGPVHEAYAERFDMDQEDPMVVDKEPPALVDEQPPEYRPDGEDYVWIPGYWGWDIVDEDYIWVSGIWRQIPPNTQWVPGYWTEADGGWQWVSGFWTSTEQEEIVYLPPPPESIDHGPSSPAPGDEYFWIPGSWQYGGGNYAWQSGYWSVGQNDWVWVPTRYVWTPSGYVCRRGYWDYRLPNRGVLFTPVRFRSNYAGLYRPRYVVDINPLWLANLFVARGVPQYYYGNHFGYQGSRQIYPWVTYYQHGYDPLLSYYAYQGRHSGWLRQLSQLEREIASTPRLQSQSTVSAQLRAQQQFRRDPSSLDTLLRVATASSLVTGSRNDFKAPISLQLDKNASVRSSRSGDSSMRELASKRRELEKAVNDTDRNRSMRRGPDGLGSNGAGADLRLNADGKIELKQLSLQRPDRGSNRGPAAIPGDFKLGSKIETRVQADADANVSRGNRDNRGNGNERRPSNADREQRIRQLAPVLGSGPDAKPLNTEQLKSIRDQLLGNERSGRAENSRAPANTTRNAPSRNGPSNSGPSNRGPSNRTPSNRVEDATRNLQQPLPPKATREREATRKRPEAPALPALPTPNRREGSEPSQRVPRSLPNINPGSGGNNLNIPGVNRSGGGNVNPARNIPGLGGDRGKSERGKSERGPGRGGNKDKKD